jgi:hypothetical protein
MSTGQVFMILVLTIAAAIAQGASPDLDCRAVASELKSMEQAQRTLLNNMVQNNDTMASTLEQYADDFKQSSRRRHPVSAKDISGLKQSAESFRQHKSREEKLVARFDQASSALLLKVESCLKQ